MDKARDYLDEIERLRVRIGLMKAEYEAAAASINLLPGVSYDGIKVISSVKDSKVLNMIETLTDKLHRLTDTIRQLETVRAERVAMINRLSDPDHIEVLSLRYVTGLYFWEVARQMNTSERNVYYLHTGALEELQRILKEVQTDDRCEGD